MTPAAAARADEPGDALPGDALPGDVPPPLPLAEAALDPSVPGPDDVAPHRSLGTNVRRGALWSAVNTLMLRVANLAIMAVVARELNVADFGVFAVAMAVYAVLSVLAEFGLTSCLLHADVDMRKVAPTVAALSLVTGVVLAGLMLVFARPLAAAAGSADAAGTVRIMSLCVLMIGVFAVPTTELAREFRQDKQFLASVIGFVPGNAVLLLLASNGGDATAFAWSRVVTQLLTGLAVTWMAPNFYRPRVSRTQVRFVLFFGLPLAGANVLNFILLNADYALVGRLLGTVELGAYMLAFTVSSWASNLVASIVNGVSMTAFSHVKDDPVRFERSLARATAAIALIALPVCGLTLALSSDLVLSLYGSKWAAASGVLTILCVYGAMSAYCLLLANVMSGTARTGALFLVQVAWLVTLVPAMALGVHFGGIIGAAWAHVGIVSLVAIPVYLVMLRRASTVRFTPMLRAVVPALIGSAVAAGVAAAVREGFDSPVARLLVGGVAGGLAYLLVVLPNALGTLGSSARLPGPIARPVTRYVDAVHRVTHRATRRIRRRSALGATS